MHPDVLTSYLNGKLDLEIKAAVDNELRDSLAGLQPEEAAVLVCCVDVWPKSLLASGDDRTRAHETDRTLRPDVRSSWSSLATANRDDPPDIIVIPRRLMQFSTRTFGTPSLSRHYHPPMGQVDLRG